MGAASEDTTTSSSHFADTAPGLLSASAQVTLAGDKGPTLPDSARSVFRFRRGGFGGFLENVIQVRFDLPCRWVIQTQG